MIEVWMMHDGVMSDSKNGIIYFSNANYYGGKALSYSFRLVALIK